jgi:phosphatidylserine decarboxylase
MGKSLKDWIESDVQPLQERSLTWLSQYHFFRDPTRASYIDPHYFFAPADGVILYQQVVKPDEDVLKVKGTSYSVRDALRDHGYDKPSLVTGVFMTFFDVHVNRIPYSGRLTYRELDQIDTINHPMLDVEREILDNLRVSVHETSYLHRNQRMVNRICSPLLGQSYYILQVADYDVDSITPFELKQNRPWRQGERFSQIRYGSQVDLIIPMSELVDFVPLQDVGSHVEGGIDPLVQIRKE